MSLLALSRTRTSIRRSRLQYSALLERLQDRAFLKHPEAYGPCKPTLFNQVLESDGETANRTSDSGNALPFHSPFDYFVHMERANFGQVADSSGHEAMKKKWNSLSTEEQDKFGRGFEAHMRGAFDDRYGNSERGGTSIASPRGASLHQSVHQSDLVHQTLQ